MSSLISFMFMSTQIPFDSHNLKLFWRRYDLRQASVEGATTRRKYSYSRGKLQTLCWTKMGYRVSLEDKLFGE